MKDQLKQKAERIGHVPSSYELEIEDYQEERALFFWKSPLSEEEGIWVELNEKGQLIDLTKYTALHSAEDPLPIERLKTLALEYVTSHYPNALEQFTFEDIHNQEDDLLQITYKQLELGKYLPHTGFSIAITKSGEIIRFLYDGLADKIVYPERVIAAHEARAILLRHLQMNLKIAVLSRELYENGDDLPHLVYEPGYHLYQLRADGITAKPEPECEETAGELLPLLKPAPSMKKTEEFIGLDRSMFKPVRKRDLGETIGTVYQAEGAEAEMGDRSLDCFLRQRNDHTLKLKTDKNSGQLKGMFSFLEREGNLQLSIPECEEIALQFLYHLYPEADQCFRMQAEKVENDKRVGFHFVLQHEGIYVDAGHTHICVNRSTGLIDHYLGPDIDPQQIRTIPTEPGISAQTAKERFIRLADVKLMWQKEYPEDAREFYQLVYCLDFPSLSGNAVFIEAEKGEVIISKKLCR
ncbi:YcdB/YcdC domain-containing protein [Bacillus xiapuensis]|uniref:YcdB/YcdC domain-containing protein n=1 Tax=Bacillus xiapuensis TaxID=2014075 RepID=UPI0012FDA2C8|nr:YcdB/YcdC domain-containing protein [Bacillus xiapuensis]